MSHTRARARNEAVRTVYSCNASKFPADKTLWWTVSAVFIIAFLVEICFVTPFHRARKTDEIHREQLDGVENTARAERSNLEQKIGALQSQLEQRVARRAIANRLGHVMEKGRKFAHQYTKGIGVPSDDEINAWTQNEVNPILTELGMAYVARYNAAEQTVSAMSTVGVPGQMIEHYIWLVVRLRVLEDFIKELTSLS